MKQTTFLLALALSAVAVRVCAQPLPSGDWEKRTMYEREIYLVKGGSTSSSYVKDYDGQVMTLPEGIGAMKFYIVPGSSALDDGVVSTAGEATVFSWVHSNEALQSTIHASDYGESGKMRDDMAITNMNYEGKLEIPSYVQLDGQWYRIKEIESSAFFWIPGITEVKLHCRYLTDIGTYAFAQYKKGHSHTWDFSGNPFTITTTSPDSYTKVDIKTAQPLRIHKDAFGNSSGTEYIDDNYSSYADDTRTCLADVAIQSDGLQIDNSAFSDCEGLQTVDINSTGLITIGSSAFSIMRISTNFEAAGKNISITKPLPRMWTRNNATGKSHAEWDYIRITGPVASIGSFAFCGHVNMKEITITDTRKGNYSMTIADHAFLNCFNGRGQEGELTITGPLTSVGASAFSHHFYTSGGDKDFEYPTGASYESCLTNVHITNTSSNALTMSYAFEDHFTTTSTNTAVASIHIEGHIANPGLFRRYPAHTDCNSVALVDRGRVRTLKIENKDLSETGVTLQSMSISNEAFQYLMDNPFATSQYGTIILSGPMQTIGQYAFRYNRALHDLTITNTSSSTPLTIGPNAFEYCYTRDVADSDITDGNAAITGLLDYIGASSFSNDKGLKLLNLTTTSDFSIGTSAFQNCECLDDMRYTNADLQTAPYLNVVPHKVNYLGAYCFRNTGFQTIEIPTLNLPTNKNRTRGESQYTKATIDGVEVPADWSAHDVYNCNDNFSYQTFMNCRHLESVTINSTATGRLSFQGCPLLSTVNIGSNVKFIEAGTFYNCASLTHLTVPANVEVVGRSIMAAGNANKRITFLATQPPYAFEHAFASNSSMTEHDINVVVPKGCVSSYLFSADDKGFQNIDNDNISCLYTLPASSRWGSLGMQEHADVKEYQVTPFYINGASGTNSYGDGKVRTLTTTTTRGSFTDVYDVNRIGMPDELDLSTLLNEAYAGTPEELEAFQNEVSGKVTELQNRFLNGEITDEQYEELLNALEAEYIEKYLELTATVSVAPRVYTVDYYYPEFGNVGIDAIQKGAIVPRSGGTTTRNIGYLINSPVEAEKYYLHHYTGEASMSSKITSIDGADYTYAGYLKVKNHATDKFNSEVIPCPNAFIETKNNDADTYDSNTAQNLFYAYQGTEDYAQGATLSVGGYFDNDLPCYFYYFSTAGKFKKMASTDVWGKMKEGNAWLAVPQYLIEATLTDADAQEFAFFITSENSTVDDETTGISDALTSANGIQRVDADRWYTIDGRLLRERPTASGLYIHNGRKEVVR